MYLCVHMWHRDICTYLRCKILRLPVLYLPVPCERHFESLITSPPKAPLHRRLDNHPNHVRRPKEGPPIYMLWLACYVNIYHGHELGGWRNVALVWYNTRQGHSTIGLGRLYQRLTPCRGPVVQPRKHLLERAQASIWAGLTCPITFRINSRRTRLF